jgi:aminoglycoside 6'-N-acetyltransferase
VLDGRAGDQELGFRRTERGDLRQIQGWLRHEHVARYWAHDTSDAAIECDFAGSIDGTEPSEDFVVECGGTAVGFVQRCRIHDYPDGFTELVELVDVPPGALTIDYFIGEPAMVGRGLGTRLIQEFTALCWRDHVRAPAIIVPVSASNVASWGALRSAGFTRIAVGHMEPDNPLDDGQHVVYRRDRPAGA